MRDDLKHKLNEMKKLIDQQRQMQRELVTIGASSVDADHDDYPAPASSQKAQSRRKEQKYPSY